MSADLKRDPVRLGSDPPPEGSESADSYEAPTRVGESAYVILARAMVEEPAQPPTSTATTAPPPPLAATASSPPLAEAPATPSEAPSAPSSAPADFAPAAGALRTEVAIAIASFLAVAIPAVLYVMYLR